MSRKIHLRHPGALNFTIDRLEIECSLPLPTRDQMRRIFERAPEPGETESMEELDRRRADELAIFCENSDVPIGKLNAEEEVQIVTAILAAHHGLEPGDAAAGAFLSIKKKPSKPSRRSPPRLRRRHPRTCRRAEAPSLGNRRDAVPRLALAFGAAAQKPRGRCQIRRGAPRQETPVKMALIQNDEDARGSFDPCHGSGSVSASPCKSLWLSASGLVRRSNGR